MFQKIHSSDALPPAQNNVFPHSVLSKQAKVEGAFLAPVCLLQCYSFRKTLNKKWNELNHSRFKLKLTIKSFLPLLYISTTILRLSTCYMLAITARAYILQRQSILVIIHEQPSKYQNILCFFFNFELLNWFLL